MSVSSVTSRGPRHRVSTRRTRATRASSRTPETSTGSRPITLSWKTISCPRWAFSDVTTSGSSTGPTDSGRQGDSALGLDRPRRSYVSGRFSPRPRSAEAIRQFRLEGSFDHILTANTGQLETRQAQLAFSTEFENSDRIGVSVAENYEFLAEPFEPGPGVIVPVGGYSFVDVEATYALGAQHRLAGIVTMRAGEYFSGNIRSVGFSRGRLELTRQLSIEPTLSLNWIDTPQGSFRTDLIVSRVNYTFTPRMFFSGLVQYNSATDSLSSNLRLRWEYSPGSELFVVYTEDRDTDPLRPDRYAELRNRGLVVKVNRLFRF